MSEVLDWTQFVDDETGGLCVTTRPESKFQIYSASSHRSRLPSAGMQRATRPRSELMMLADSLARICYLLHRGVPILRVSPQNVHRLSLKRGTYLIGYR